jgi:hypothetical protein
MADNRKIDPAVEQEFSPDQGSIRHKTPGPREQAKDDRDEQTFAENVDPAAEGLARQRRSSSGAGISNRPLSTEQEEQTELPERNTRKSSTD